MALRRICGKDGWLDHAALIDRLWISDRIDRATMIGCGTLDIVPWLFQ